LAADRLPTAIEQDYAVRFRLGLGQPLGQGLDRGLNADAGQMLFQVREKVHASRGLRQADYRNPLPIELFDDVRPRQQLAIFFIEKVGGQHSELGFLEQGQGSALPSQKSRWQRFTAS